MQDLRREGFLLPQQTQQEVFGADVLVLEPLRLFGGGRQHALALLTQRQVHRGRDLFPDRRSSLNLLPDRLNRGVGGAQEAVGKRFVFTEQAEQEVLGLNVGTPKLTGFVAGEEDYAAGLLGITLEHKSSVVGFDLTTPPRLEDRHPATRPVA